MDLTPKYSDQELDKDEYIKVLEDKNAKLSRRVDIQESQKNSLKKRILALRNTINELLENKAWQSW